LDVASALERYVELIAPNELTDDCKVKDILEGNTIWKKYIGVAQARKLVVYNYTSH